MNNIYFKVENPDDVVITLTVSMKLPEWKELKDQQMEKWPSSSFKSTIGDLIRKADLHFYPTE